MAVLTSKTYGVLIPALWPNLLLENHHLAEPFSVLPSNREAPMPSGPRRQGRALFVNDRAMTGHFGGWRSSQDDVEAGGH